MVSIGGLLSSQLYARLPFGEPTAELASRDIGCILDAHLGPDLVLDHVPVVLLELVEVLLRRQWLLVLRRQALELRVAPPHVVLFEGLALGELLEDLVSSRYFPLRLGVEGELRPERGWGYNLDAAVLVDVFVAHELLNVEEGVSKLVLRGPKSLHFFDFVDVGVHVRRLQKRVPHRHLKLTLLLGRHVELALVFGLVARPGATA